MVDDRRRALLVPVKSFSRAKLRLAGVLEPAERAALARRLATGVLAAGGSADRHVACDDEEVARWAERHAASVLWTPGLGLSGAVTEGVRRLSRSGFGHVIVAHADLPFAEDLDAFGEDGEVTLAPDRSLQGTNVAALPPSSGFSFAYGVGSFGRHRKEAGRVGLGCRVVHDWRLAWDVDLPDDLALVH
ncbi:MAG TPA: 2-phospho-L-lactate guanylyltransferase [Acidimicrobiales bacterium]|nr:2-phospho-L-lactate guanylyltransferase [Acidimicrobiales bacterium]